MTILTNASKKEEKEEEEKVTFHSSFYEVKNILIAKPDDTD